MPVRLLREGILTSDRVDLLSAVDEVFYRRLMSVVDDFGRYDGRPAILRSSMYPLRIERVREADIVRSLARCQEAGLIRLYNVSGKPYLEMLNFRQQVRAKASKYPSHEESDDPSSSCEAPAKQMLATAHLDVVEDEDEDGTPKGPQGGLEEPEGPEELPIPPAPPSKGNGDGAKVLPTGWEKLTSKVQRTRKVICNNRLMQRIGRWFNRRPDTLWTIAEAAALKEAGAITEQVELLESYYLAIIDPDRDHRRKDLITLLNNWNGELDRANGWKAGNNLQ